LEMVVYGDGLLPYNYTLMYHMYHMYHM